VDDSAINRRMIAGILRLEQYQVQVASSGAMALEMARAQPPI
jgi:CheY-like chemotaxis protein